MVIRRLTFMYSLVVVLSLAVLAAEPRQANATSEKPGTGAWTNYDFVPGERVLFAEDFSADVVGDFPRRLTLLQGNWDVIEWQGQRLLRNTGPRHAAVNIPLPEVLPERFTIEMDVHFPQVNQTLIVSTEENSRHPQGNVFQIGRSGTGVAGGAGSKVSALNREYGTIEKAMTTIRIMVDGQYAKVYVNERRVTNVPNGLFVRTKVLQLRNGYMANDANPMLIASIRIAAGGRDLYDVLERDGRVATQGIYFATDSDVIRPESTPTLKEIGALLTSHPDLRLSIEGHTDSVGDDAYNLALSERRARAVKAYLVESVGIDANRLEAAGRGEAAPVADNATPEGQQQNRRVELVKRGLQ